MTAETVLWSKTIPEITVPHRIDLVRSAAHPPAELITCGFVVATELGGRIAMTFIDRPGRGWDIPGGHLDPGESAAEAALRELAEETGLRLDLAALRLLGWTRITREQRPPEDRYPYPVSFMVFFAAAVPQPLPLGPEPGHESTDAAWLTRAEIQSRCTNPDWLPLLPA
ncbi:NUDIX domain-containing protein [Microlunatus speluncae]|uniref:NUDIX domain-containing protein n=1 Tax=Microlunatus speluncae TaxID=2594267 RepID=UPI001375E1A0|nr:NUDIX domain-containing protein [Microlunatus speluncae]